MAGKKGMKWKNKDPVTQEQLETMCTDYLRDNFHKFSEAHKQKIALTIASKAVTQKTQIDQTMQVVEAQQDQIAEQVRLYGRNQN